MDNSVPVVKRARIEQQGDNENGAFSQPPQLPPVVAAVAPAAAQQPADENVPPIQPAVAAMAALGHFKVLSVNWTAQPHELGNSLSL